VNKQPQTIQLILSAEEVQGVVNVLNQLPTSSGAWPLVVKIEQQAKEQLPKKEEE
jgi:hypothetical protein